MEQNKIILYQDDNEITRVAVRFADEDLWLTQNQLDENDVTVVLTPDRARGKSWQ